MSKGDCIELEQALHILDVVMSDDSIKHKGKAIRKRLMELPTEDFKKLKTENDRLEKLVAINKGAMRAYREECEKAHDEAVKDFSHFLIDKAEGGSIEVAELSDLVAEWKSPSRKSEKVTNEINEALDKASATLRSGSLTGKGFYETRFERVE